MLEDDVLFLQAASTMGKEGLKALAADYVSPANWLVPADYIAIARHEAGGVGPSAEWRMMDLLHGGGSGRQEARCVR